jgi:hypothetical protein
LLSAIFFFSWPLYWPPDSILGSIYISLHNNLTTDSFD